MFRIARLKMDKGRLVSLVLILTQDML